MSPQDPTVPPSIVANPPEPASPPSPEEVRDGLYAQTRAVYRGAVEAEAMGRARRHMSEGDPGAASSVLHELTGRLERLDAGAPR